MSEPVKVPAGACDTHMHFYHHRYPAAPTALIQPPDAWIEDYRALQRRLGLERVVVVQPTTYGRDNRAMLDALGELGEAARGVVVVDDGVSDQELETLTARGVCGVRFHMLPGGALPWDLLETVAARVAPFGWHVQLQMNGHDAPLARALVIAAPERMLWASNWPHPGQDPAPDDARLLDLLGDWVDDEAARERILVTNPATLYGFA